jgi:hypothetical protein
MENPMKLAGFLSLSLIGLFAACGGSDSNSDDQTPPTSGRVDVEQWLKDASYKTWTCEPAIHASRAPSPHGFNKICSNDLIVNAATGTGTWPKGAAAVKEIYASLTATTPTGYAVYLKTNADSADGANWYWYERVPSDSDAPHDPTTGVVADGMGGAGTAKSICVGCHAAAGMDASHTPSTGGRDQVYTPVH